MGAGEGPMKRRRTRTKKVAENLANDDAMTMRVLSVRKGNE